MPLINTWFFTKTIIDWETIAKVTHNQFRVVSVRPYVDKKGNLPEGYSVTLMVIKDEFDYGIGKDGQPRENNLYQTFDVTILTRKSSIKKGDVIRLLDFDNDHSYAIGFDLLLRFRDFEVLQAQGVKANA